MFQLSPPASGQRAWRFSVIHSFPLAFSAGPFGTPLAKMIDGRLTLFGTSQNSELSGHGGTVFRLTAPATPGAAWPYDVLYDFPASDKTGAYPRYPLIADRSLNLYGVTFSGGAAGYGTVYRLSPPASGQTAWTASLLHSFTGRADGSYPGPLTEGNGSRLYGDAGGSLFSLTPRDNGGHALPWNFAGLYTAGIVTGSLAPSTATGFFPALYAVGADKKNVYPGSVLRLNLPN